MAKRWCFTINNPEQEDRFWEAPELDKTFDYIIVQEERGENGTLHYQGFLILKKQQRLSWLKLHCNERAHWEVARGTNEQARDYCRKDETYTGGLRFEFGKIPERAAVKKREERLQDAAEELDILKEGYKRPAEIPSMTLLQCGFIPAMKELTAEVLGPYRPELKIITMVGGPGTGKSYAIQQNYPEHGRAIYGNNGVWFQNPTADVMIFEEFNGQIPLQRMLQLLDPYPLALEVKGGMRPAMYKTVIITSNTSPDMWYPINEEKATAVQVQRRQDSIHALWDRLGYANGSYVPIRKCGTYIQAPLYSASFGMSIKEYIETARKQFMAALYEAANGHEDISDDDEIPQSL